MERNFLTQIEFRCLWPYIDAEIKDNMSYIKSFYTNYKHMCVARGKKDDTYQKASNVFTETWTPWCGIQKIILKSAESFFEKHERVVFRYNDFGRRLLNSFFSASGLITYDNLERDQTKDVLSLCLAFAHNSTRCDSRTPIVVRVFVPSPTKRDSNFHKDYENAVVKACGNPPPFSPPPYGSHKVYSSTPSSSSSSSSDPDSDDDDADESNLVSVDTVGNDMFPPMRFTRVSQEIGPTLYSGDLYKTKITPITDLKNTLAETEVDGVVFTADKRLKYADAAKTYGFHFLNQGLPKTPLPCCHDLDEREERVAEGREKT